MASEQGYHGQDNQWGIDRDSGRWEHVMICPSCDHPTFFDAYGGQTPGEPFGDQVEHVPDDVKTLYDEARSSMGQRNLTSAVLAGRKVLMHVAVEKGAPEGARFIEYVNYLVDNNVVTTDMKDWVDEIRELGNDANHEIALPTREDAEALMTFVGMLLRIAYEYPRRAQLSAEARRGRGDPGEPRETAAAPDLHQGARPPIS